MSLKGRSCWDVKIRMHEAEKLSLEAIGRFVEASEEIRFESEDRQQLYGWVERVLVEQEYAQQGKAARGLLRRYIEKMTGLSRAQVTRLIALYTASGRVQATLYKRRRFAERYTRADVELLASVYEAHETLSGPAIHPSGQRPSAGDLGDTAHSGARARGLQAARVCASPQPSATPMQRGACNKQKRSCSRSCVLARRTDGWARGRGNGGLWKARKTMMRVFRPS